MDTSIDWWIDDGSIDESRQSGTRAPTTLESWRTLRVRIVAATPSAGSMRRSIYCSNSWRVWRKWGGRLTRCGGCWSSFAVLVIVELRIRSAPTADVLLGFGCDQLKWGSNLPVIRPGGCKLHGKKMDCWFWNSHGAIWANCERLKILFAKPGAIISWSQDSDAKAAWMLMKVELQPTAADCARLDPSLRNTHRRIGDAKVLLEGWCCCFEVPDLTRRIGTSWNWEPSRATNARGVVLFRVRCWETR